MTAEEQGQWDGLNNELDQIEKRMRGMAEQEKRSKETASLFENIQAQPNRGGADPVKSAAELRAFLKGDPGSPRAIDFKPSSYEERVLSKLSAGAGAKRSSHRAAAGNRSSRDRCAVARRDHPGRR